MSNVRKYKEDGEVKCPFYRRECDVEIKCEGIVSEMVGNLFRTVKQKKAHKEAYCLNNYNACKVCKELMDKYKGS